MISRKIINFDKFKFCDIMYDITEFITEIGCRYLPSIFYFEVIIDGNNMNIPKFVTMREWKNIEKRAEETEKSINWE